MTLEQVFYLSQSIASVAVLGSLIYLGLQVRASDRGQRSHLKQRRAGSYPAFFRPLWQLRTSDIGGTQLPHGA